MADVKTEREMSRSEVAAYLHEFADKFGDDSGTTDREERETVESTASKTESADANHDEATDENEGDDGTDRDSGTDRETGTTREGRVTFTLGNESATVDPPETVEFTVAVDSTAGMLESGAHETVSFTLDWDVETTDDEGELGLH